MNLSHKQRARQKAADRALVAQQHAWEQSQDHKVIHRLTLKGGNVISKRDAHDGRSVRRHALNQTFSGGYHPEVGASMPVWVKKEAPKYYPLSSVSKRDIAGG